MGVGLRRRAGRVLGRVATRIRRSRRLHDFSNRYSREGLFPFVDAAIEDLEALPGKKRVLSVGAGGELGARVAAIRNHELVTVDDDPKRRPDIVADVCDLSKFADASLDAVFLLEVLEHVRTPDRAIAEIHRVLAEGGVLVLSTPFVFEIHDAPRDYYRFTRFGLEFLLRDFASVEVRPRNGYLKSMLVPLLRLYRSRYSLDVCFGLVVAAFVFLLRPLVEWLDGLVRSDAATSGYVATCRK
jgi:SAM-dependent methyltransferase